MNDVSILFSHIQGFSASETEQSGTKEKAICKILLILILTLSPFIGFNFFKTD